MLLFDLELEGMLLSKDNQTNRKIQSLNKKTGLQGNSMIGFKLHKSVYLEGKEIETTKVKGKEIDQQASSEIPISGVGVVEQVTKVPNYINTLFQELVPR